MDPFTKQFTSLVERAVEASVERSVSRLAPRFRTDERDRPGPPKAFLTNAEAQVYLGLSKATLARFRADGVLPFSKVGQSIYYAVADIEALLERSAVGPAASGDSNGGTIPVLTT